MLSSRLAARYETLRARVAACDGAVVAFSGGADSALLLRVARDVLGDRCLAVTAVSASLPRSELEAARRFAADLGVRHRLVRTDEMGQEEFARNTGRRCFFCKAELFDHAFAVAEEEGLDTVFYGANADDVGDHRPGMDAARRKGARAPLLEAELTKQDVRDLSRHLGLSTWDKPAMACLSSRIPYGTRVTPERLRQVEAAEEALRTAGFREFRVRHHGEVARIELAGREWGRLADPVLRDALSRAVRAAGFRFASVDLEGFRSGRLNEALQETAAPGEPRWPDDASA